MYVTKRHEQLDYVCHPEGGIIVDKLLKYEDGLHIEVPKLFKEWNVKIPSDLEFPRANVSKEKPNMEKYILPDYRDYYTDELREIVAERHKRTIEMFNYEF